MRGTYHGNGASSDKVVETYVYDATEWIVWKNAYCYTCVNTMPGAQVDGLVTPSMNVPTCCPALSYEYRTY